MKASQPKPAQPPGAQPLLDTKEAAALLGVAPTTLKISRCTGMLLGASAPKYRKLGARAVRYEASALADWLAQFEPRTSTGR